MKKIILLAIVLASVILEATILNGFRVFNVKPNLTLLVLVLYSIFLNQRLAVGTGLFAGCLRDILSVNVFPVYTLTFVVWCMFVCAVSKKINLEQGWHIQAAFVFIIVIINSVVVKMLFVNLGHYDISAGIFLRTALLEALYTAAIAPFAFKVSLPIITSQWTELS